MGIANEQLKAENIRNISIIDLAKLTVELSEEQNQIQAEAAKAYEANDIDLLLAHASAGGVVGAQINIIGLEVERRYKEEGPMSEDEREELHNYVMQQALARILGGL